MGADGHIAIYDYEKVEAFLLSAHAHYKPKYKRQEFTLEQRVEAEAFASEKKSCVSSSCGGYSTNRITEEAQNFYVSYQDLQDTEPHYWPGYICDWTCNGKRACIVYWGDNIYSDPFEGCEWLQEWANENALLVKDQEVWT